MGCDIHVHMEIKVGGKWEHFNAPRVSRSYDLFCLMAGVRGPRDGVTPISAPRGLPEDASLTTRLVSRFEDGHSHSWLSSSEMAQVEAVTDEWAKSGNREWYAPFGYFFGNSWSMESPHPPEVEDFRAVFYFDS